MLLASQTIYETMGFLTPPSSQAATGLFGQEIVKMIRSLGWDHLEAFVEENECPRVCEVNPGHPFFIRIHHLTRVPSYISHTCHVCVLRPILGTVGRLSKIKIEMDLTACCACRLNALAHIKQVQVNSTFREGNSHHFQEASYVPVSCQTPHVISLAHHTAV